MSKSLQHFFATSPRGLESVLAQEITALGGQNVVPTHGGVSFSGEFTLCYRANLESRVASRILWQVASRPYRSEDDIYKTVYALPWTDWFDVRRTIMVKVSAQKCPLRSLDFVTLKIKDAVCDKFRALKDERPSVDTANPDMRIHAFLDERQFTLYLDTSGNALFQRGLRKHSVEAPLRENLAAGILKLAGWQPGIPLLDPMCGSGTFLLEAAQMALNIAPGMGRSFAFEKLRNFDKTAWESMKSAAQACQLPPTAQPIYGSDISNTVLNATRANFEAAGLSDVVEIKQANFLDIAAPAAEGALVTNPPYGVRLSDMHELAALYPEIGSVLKRKFAGWRAYIFTADLRLPKLMRLNPSRKTPLFNGALECRLYEFKMVAGSMRRDKNPASEPPSAE